MQVKNTKLNLSLKDMSKTNCLSEKISICLIWVELCVGSCWRWGHGLGWAGGWGDWRSK